MSDFEYLKKAIINSEISLSQGNFPAGALVVKNNEIVASAVSSQFPNLLHSDSKAIIQAFEKIGPLRGCTLYVGLQPCLMCASIAYWSGLRRIVYAVPYSKLPQQYYVTKNDDELLAHFHEKIETIQINELTGEALVAVRNWELNNSKLRK